MDLYKEWTEPAHRTIVSKTADRILELQHSSERPQSTIEMTLSRDGDSIQMYRRCHVFAVDDLVLPWLKRLYVCVSSDVQWYEEDRRTPVDYRDYNNTSFVIGDTEAYSWNDKFDELFTTNVSFKIAASFLGSIFVPYLPDYENGHIVSATVMFNIPFDKWNSEHLRFIIQHELSHIHDMFVQEMNQRQLNLDIAFNGADQMEYTREHPEVDTFLKAQTTTQQRIALL